MELENSEMKIYYAIRMNNVFYIRVIGGDQMLATKHTKFLTFFRTLKLFNLDFDMIKYISG